MLEWLLLFFGRVGQDGPRHPTRQRILAVVQEQPGITLTALRNATKCSWGTIQHHTRTLERRGILLSEPLGRSRRFFPAATPQEERRAVALLGKGRVRELVEAIRDQPGAVQRDLTEGLQLTRKVLRAYVDDLVAQGLVEEARDARSRTYHATKTLEALLARAPVPEPSTL